MELRAWKAGYSGIRTYFIYDGSTPIIEMDGSGNAKSVNTFGANGLISRRTFGTNRWTDSSIFYTFDERGNTVERLDITGGIEEIHIFDAFGEFYGNETTDPFDFGGQFGYYTDWETFPNFYYNDWQTAGLILCGLRYYDPSAGRWLTRDPIGYAGGINLYEYVTNNPVMEVDPSGLRPLTSRDISLLRKLYDRIPNNIDAPEKSVNQAVRQIKKLIFSVSPTSGDPANLKAVLWALEQLGNKRWNINSTVKLSGFKNASPRQNKCNYFVAAAYLEGAGVKNWPDTRGKGWLNRFPASANMLASNGDLGHLPFAGTAFEIGDIVAFNSPSDSGHATLYLGAGLLIYAGEDAKVGTFLDNAQYEDHNGSKVRRYAP